MIVVRLATPQRESPASESQDAIVVPAPTKSWFPGRISKSLLLESQFAQKKRQLHRGSPLLRQSMANNCRPLSDSARIRDIGLFDPGVGTHEIQFLIRFILKGM